jgi:hypothetical protein
LTQDVLRRSVTDFFRDAAARKMRKKLSFAEILADFCADNRITQWKPEFTTFRNRMFHGLAIPGPTLLDQYWRVMDVAHFCDVVVLALLNWDASGGRYVPCNAEQMTVTEKNRGRVKTCVNGERRRPSRLATGNLRRPLLTRALRSGSS